jgi:hypothetical protein
VTPQLLRTTNFSIPSFRVILVGASGASVANFLRFASALSEIVAPPFASYCHVRADMIDIFRGFLKIAQVGIRSAAVALGLAFGLTLLQTRAPKVALIHLFVTAATLGAYFVILFLAGVPLSPLTVINFVVLEGLCLEFFTQLLVSYEGLRKARRTDPPPSDVELAPLDVDNFDPDVDKASAMSPESDLSEQSLVHPPPPPGENSVTTLLARRGVGSVAGLLAAVGSVVVLTGDSNSLVSFYFATLPLICLSILICHVTLTLPLALATFAERNVECRFQLLSRSDQE